MMDCIGSITRFSFRKVRVKVKMDFPVFSAMMAHQLIEEGFKYVNKRVNKRYPEKYVYYFEESDAIRARVQEIVRSLKDL